MSINEQNNRHTTPPQTHIAFIIPRPKGIGSRHKSGTGNNQDKQIMTPHGNRCFNCKYIHSNSNVFSSPVITVPLPLNSLVINPPHLSSVCQHLSSSSQNTTPELQASSIPGRTSPDPSKTMTKPSNKNRSRIIYGCMVDLSKLTPAQRQQYAVTLLQHYHELCNTNDPSSMFVYSPPIPNIESLFQPTISSLYILSFFLLVRPPRSQSLLIMGLCSSIPEHRL